MTKVLRGPRKRPPALDQVLEGTHATYEWVESAATFLTALESSVLAGDAAVPLGLCRRLHDLLRHAS